MTRPNCVKIWMTGSVLSVEDSMFQVTLSEIQWAERGDKLPSTWTYQVDDAAEADWETRLKRDFRGNQFEFRRLLKDVFQVEAERQHGGNIIRCKMNVARGR